MKKFCFILVGMLVILMKRILVEVTNLVAGFLRKALFCACCDHNLILLLGH